MKTNTKKIRLGILLLVLLPSTAVGVVLPSGFKTQRISRPVRDFARDSINLSTPLDYYASRAWVVVSGKERLWSDISTSKFMFDRNAPDRVPADYIRDYVLDETIEEIITYRDSAASIITHPVGENRILFNTCWIENGRWVNGGQGIAEDIDGARKIAYESLPAHYGRIQRIERIRQIPEDASPFVRYLSGIKTSPERYLLDKASSHKLVINGEYHRRKVSWDMLKRLIRLPKFPDKVGTVFMELPSRCQAQMDSFMNSDSLDPEKILQIFREEQIYGWWDRGEFEFICDLWRRNHSLKADKRVRIVLADYQPDYASMSSEKYGRAEEDRNTHMADVIANELLNSPDSRNGLFLVGCGHASKSRQPGYASAADGRDAALTAGAQLAERLGDDNVFTVFQHVAASDNSGNNKSLLRGGVFDRAFEANGNRPVGFDLKGSPFGEELFDGIYEIKFNAETGTYADNFDGYLFLHPLEDEPKATPLTEIFTDEFVGEIKRRASAMGIETLFGSPVPELTKEYITGLLWGN